jgi:hypothetical protein
MTDEEILQAEEMLESQTTFNEDSLETLVEEGEIENVCN